MNEQESFFDKLAQWMKNSIILKLLTITFIMLLLLIPASMVRSVINERNMYQMEAEREVRMDWAEDQMILGPILSIPIIHYNKEEKKESYRDYYHILPEDLKIDVELNPRTLKRGIYDVIVYDASIEVAGSFKPKVDRQFDETSVIGFDQSFLTLGIADLKGIQNQIDFNFNNNVYSVDAGVLIPNIINSGLTVDLSDTLILDNEYKFSYHMELQGGELFEVVPVGKVSDISVVSDWTNPSFYGDFLPDNRDVSKDGFTASWRILEINRNIPQTWLGSLPTNSMYNTKIGVRIIEGVDDYQQSTRSAKYAVLTISLTFLIFFIVEIFNKHKIHPFQYILVGLAVCIFYILLVSISEQLNFNSAYWLSSAAVIAMIVLYSLSIFKRIKYSIVLALLMTMIYAFVFVVLSLEDYALLIGSLGLFLILGATMYLTRNINWYDLKFDEEQKSQSNIDRPNY